MQTHNLVAGLNRRPIDRTAARTAIHLRDDIAQPINNARQRHRSLLAHSVALYFKSLAIPNHA